MGYEAVQGYFAEKSQRYGTRIAVLRLTSSLSEYLFRREYNLTHFSSPKAAAAKSIKDIATGQSL
jgi:hypothetical protein